jgi:hypothetical protein
MMPGDLIIIRKLFTFIVLLNLAGLVVAIMDVWPYPRNYTDAMILGNLLTAILVRNELFGRFAYLLVNKLFARVSGKLTLLHGSHAFWQFSGLPCGFVLVVLPHSNISVESILVAQSLVSGGSSTTWPWYSSITKTIQTRYLSSGLWQALLWQYALEARFLGFAINITSMILVFKPGISEINHIYSVFERHHRFLGWLGLIFSEWLMLKIEPWMMDTVSQHGFSWY